MDSISADSGVSALRLLLRVAFGSPVSSKSAPSSSFLMDPAVDVEACALWSRASELVSAVVVVVDAVVDVASCMARD